MRRPHGVADGGRELGDDGEQLVDAVRAAVAGADRLQAVRDERRAQRRDRRGSAARCARHLRAVARDQIVLPGRNRPSASSHGAETSGMPQASASNTRIVGMPGRIVE